MSAERRWQTGGMVRLLLDSAQLDVSLSGTEQAWSFHRGDLRIPRDSIEKVQLTDDLWTWIRGARSSGTALPGILAAGRWTSAAGEDFLMVRRHRPGVVIDLAEGSAFHRLLLTTRHGHALVAALQLAGETSPVEVTELAAAAKKPTRSH